jgi:ribosomal protein S18 acetylase RimI-like enzyme
MQDSKAYLPPALYIENIVIKEPLRLRGYGRRLYQKIASFARNIHADYIQIDSEQDAVGFWQKLGFKEIDVTYYHNKTAMIKKLKPAS